MSAKRSHFGFGHAEPETEAESRHSSLQGAPRTAARDAQRGAWGAHPAASTGAQVGTGAHTAFLLLRTLFTVAPIVFGLDKFTNLLTQWDQYLAPWIDGVVPGTASQAMYAIGAIEIVAGLLVAWRPKIGAWIVAAWLVGIVLNLLTYSGFYDIALRDAGLAVGAVALALLARDES